MKHEPSASESQAIYPKESYLSPIESAFWMMSPPYWPSETIYNKIRSQVEPNMIEALALTLIFAIVPLAGILLMSSAEGSEID